MKMPKAILTTTFFWGVMCISFKAFSQSPESKILPVSLLSAMRDSTTSVDIVFLKGEGGSISAEGNNIRLFNSFVENAPAEKSNSQPSGTIMWLINGRELISGNYFLGDSTGYVVFQKDGKEFVNKLSAQGNAFFKSQIK